MKNTFILSLLVIVLASCGGGFSKKAVSDFKKGRGDLENHATVTIGAWSGGHLELEKAVGFHTSSRIRKTAKPTG